MADHSHGTDLLRIVALLGAGVVAVPLFRRLGLGSVLGYLAAGLAIGPFGLALFTDSQAILNVAELGVVMFLFVIGLEMQPSRLWTLRKAIFGLGLFQVAVCGALLTVVVITAGRSPQVAFIAAMGFVLSSTAIAVQILEERGAKSSAAGQRVVSILLLEDLMIVPLLGVVAFMAPGAQAAASDRWQSLAIAVGALLGLVFAGKYLLNPVFRVLANSRAREVMTAAALLVVLGAAFLMQLGGLSMAMGAFLAGVLLSQSSFRHQLEADIEPFRGILLGLFFMSVGMSLNLAVFAASWQLILVGSLVLMVVKSIGVYGVARITGADNREALYRSALLAQGGEFAFVLYAAAADARILDETTDALLTSMVIVSMAATPLAVAALRWLLPKRPDTAPGAMEGIDAAADLHGSALLIGFGRFGQVVSQSLLARGVDVALIDTDTDMIRAAADFGFKVYYGDGTRLDVLRACGAAEARAILICVDDREAARRITRLVKSEFPQALLLARSFDREHALELIADGVDLQVRETFDSAMRFGEQALLALGASESEAAQIAADVRQRDAERLQMEITGGRYAGRELLRGNAPLPPMIQKPLITPQRAARPLSEATAAVTGKDEVEHVPAG